MIGQCASHGIALHLKKFTFTVPEEDYCGFKNNKFGYTASDRMVQALAQFPT